MAEGVTLISPRHRMSAADPDSEVVPVPEVGRQDPRKANRIPGLP